MLYEIGTMRDGKLDEPYRYRLEIELQTGDTVQITAEYFSWKIMHEEARYTPEQPIEQPLYGTDL